MARLTEEMVAARTRASDLSTIKKLNCWGAELQDISLLRRLSNVEVLSLSVNKISTLADIQHCKNLRELYVRKNNINNLNEICYLKNLPHLTALWLGENPCCASDSMYRMTVIRNLPSLEKLDDVKIEPEERQDALRKGKILIHPEDSDAENVAAVSLSQSPTRAIKSPSVTLRLSEHAQEDFGNRKKGYGPDDNQLENYATFVPDYKYAEENDPGHLQQLHRTGDAVCDRTSHDNGINKTNTMSGKFSNVERGSSREIPYIQASSDRPVDQQEDSIGNKEEDEYCSCPNHLLHDRSVPVNSSAYEANDLRRGSSESMSPQKRNFEEDAYSRYHSEKNYSTQSECDYQRPEEETRISEPSYYLPRKPVTRNSNLLSAVLCLIKELDYQSLEVVGIAVKCRMDEFED